jgi:BNR repeat-containing family member
MKWQHALRLNLGFVLLTTFVSAINSSSGQTLFRTNYVRGTYRELNDNGAWSWFMDERAIVDKGRLMVGSVRTNGKFRDNTLPGWGNVELSILDLKSGEKRNVILHEHFEQDDHDGPGLLVLRDGRYLAAYSKHGQETRMYYRISTKPADPYEWGSVREFESPGTKGGRTEWGNNDNFTYCNPFRLSRENGHIYLLNRSHGLDPNYFISDDDARTWRYGGKLYVGRDGYSPYTKYVSDGRDTIHFVSTEDHPRNFDNSLYHGFIRKGNVYGSDGKLLGPLSTSTNATLRPWNFTRIYQGGSNNVAWMTDIELDKSRRPVVLFTVQMNSAGLPRGEGGMDHRFHYARWDGKRWQENEIAFAGKRLYPGEDDYTGLGAIDPQNADIVCISTDADPNTGAPLISKADGRRHYELFRGTTRDGGKTWNWTPITANSTTDNLRPIIPRWKDSRTALVWMRGSYRAYGGEWTTKVVTSILRPVDFLPDSMRKPE